jgi:hypothetical protein
LLKTVDRDRIKRIILTGYVCWCLSQSVENISYWNYFRIS